MTSLNNLGDIPVPYRLDNNKLLEVNNLSDIENLITDNEGTSSLNTALLLSYAYKTTTIGYKYINQKNDPSTTKSNSEIFYDIVIEHIQANLISIPKDIETIRLTGLKFGDIIGGGDNLAGNTWHKKTNRPLVINEKDLASLSLQSVINNAHTDEFNYEYIDIDLCSAILSLEFKKPFDQRVDDFGDLIMEIRGLLTVETKNSLIDQIHAAHGNTNPENTNPGNTNPGNTNPGNTESENTNPGNTESENTNPGNTNPGNTESENTDPPI